MGIDAVSLLMAGVVYYGAPLLEHVNSRISGELSAGFDALFDKVTQRLPWNKFKKSTLQETALAINKELKLDEDLKLDTSRLAAEMTQKCPHIYDIVQDFSGNSGVVMNINNSGARIERMINIGSQIKNQNNFNNIIGNVYIGTDRFILRLESHARSHNKNYIKTYYYGSNLLDLFGREDEMNALRTFVDASSKLSMLLMTGQGGVGKSRLAFELCNEYRSKGYDAGFLAKHHADIAADWSPERPTLIVIDYAAERIKQICQIISLYEYSHGWRYPVKVLLIERDEELLNSYLMRDKAFDAELFDCIKFFNNSSLSINPLHKSDLLKIMRQVLNQNRYEKPISDDMLWRLFNKVDPKKRTIFAAYLAEAISSEDIGLNECSAEGVLDRIYKKEMNRWKELTKNNYDCIQHINLMYLATLNGGCLKSVFDDHGASTLLPGYSHELYASLVSACPEKNGVIYPIEPDIFGEYFLLKLYDEMSTKQNGIAMLERLNCVAWRQPLVDIHNVMYRLFADFHDLDKVLKFCNWCISCADESDVSTRIALLCAKNNIGLSLNILGRHKDALKILKEVAKQDPSFAFAWDNMGASLSAVGQHKMAIEAHDRAIKLNAGNAYAHANKAATHADAGDYSLAAKEIGKAIKINPTIASFWCEYGYILGAYMGQYSEGIAALDKSLELKPNEAMTWLKRGMVLLADKKYQEAVDSNNMAIKLGYDGCVAWDNLGNALLHLGRYEECMQACNHAIKIYPDNVASRVNMSRLYMHSEQYDEAHALLTEALRIQPDNFIALNNVCSILLRKKLYDKALIIAEKQIELDPQSSLSWMSRAASLEGLGRLKESIPNFEKAISLDPNSSSAWAELGRALYNLGQYKQALNKLTRAVELYPDNIRAWEDIESVYEALGSSGEAAQAQAVCNEVRQSGVLTEQTFTQRNIINTNDYLEIDE